MPARTAIKAAIAVLAGWVTLSALVSCAVDIGALQHRTSSYSLSGQLHTLVVKAHVGSVHITGSGSGQVLVTERISFRGTAPGTTHRTAADTGPWTAVAPPWRPAPWATTSPCRGR